MYPQLRECIYLVQLCLWLVFFLCSTSGFVPASVLVVFSCSLLCAFATCTVTTHCVFSVNEYVDLYHLLDQDVFIFHALMKLPTPVNF